MAIINTGLANTPPPEYVWVEYRIDTTTWTTSEYRDLLVTSTPDCEIVWTQSNAVFLIYVYSAYTINQSTGAYNLSNSQYIGVQRGEKKSIGGWVHWENDPPNKIRWIDTIECVGNMEHDHMNQLKSIVCFTKFMTSTLITIPHSSSSISNSILRIHLNEPTADENHGNFAKFPFVI